MHFQSGFASNFQVAALDQGIDARHQKKVARPDDTIIHGEDQCLANDPRHFPPIVRHAGHQQRVEERDWRGHELVAIDNA
jgi:hypothetical protein